MGKQIKILIADDHPVFRHGLSMIIKSEKDFVLIGEADNGEKALEIIENENPDVVILDLDMPVMDGVATSRALQSRFPKIKTVFLTMHKDKEILNMMKSLNIKGYILKDSAIIEIVDCIKKVFADKTFISPAIADLLLDEVSHTKNPHSKEVLTAKLTSAEKRIIKLIAETKTNREIAEELFISIRTVENHRLNICHKLDLKGNHSLVKFAISNKKHIFQINK